MIKRHKNHCIQITLILCHTFCNTILFLVIRFSFLPTLTLVCLPISLISLQEIEQSMNMLSPNPELPDMSELVTKFFSGSKGSSKAGGSSKGTRPAVKRR